MKSPLKSIASVQMGFSFRTRLDVIGPGNTAVIQMKDLTDDNHVDRSSPIHIQIENLKAHHLIKPGDLIFRSRGLLNTCAILSHDPGQAVLAAPLFRIRTDPAKALPEYVLWAINHPASQAYLASRSKGTAQKMISKQGLEELEVAVPSVERQHAIIELAALCNREQHLMKRIAERRSHYMNARLAQLMKGA